MEDKQQSSKFFNGFLIGAVFGVTLTLLLVTKKGRKILHELSDEGKDSIEQLRTRFSEVEQMVEDELLYEDEAEEGVQSMDVDTDDTDLAVVKPQAVRHAPTSTKSASNGIKKHPRRLFKGIPKK